MARSNDLKPLTISRSFAAPRELVFKAWSSAEHMKRWFSPEGLSVPEAEMEFRPGGVCNICMRSPEGHDYWSYGKYIEITPPDRLVFISDVIIGGAKKFTVHSTVTFEEDGAGTLMTVRQLHEIHDEAFSSAIDGATEGWRTTLDKLEREVARIKASQAAPPFMAASRSSAFTMLRRGRFFTLFRTRTPSPARFPAAKDTPCLSARWMCGPAGASG
jgi:uncharacterized protein YndB with AHSA1/START domain